jgi:hypothetical protein
MITGLLFTLAQKPPVAANDKNSEGRHFPPSSTKKVKASHNVVRLTQIVSVILTMIGASLLSVGTASWSFDPAHGLDSQMVVLSFTLPVGVLS